MRRLFTLLLILFVFCSYAQHPAVSQPGYNPTVPRLISMQHKVVSHTYKPVKPTIQDFETKVSSEEINVYMLYQKDSIVGTTTDDKELFHPPLKLMDLSIFYEYHYKIYVPANDMLDQLIPKISLLSGGYVDDIKIVNYYRDNTGKLKDKRIKKSSSKIYIEDGYLTVIPEQNQVAHLSYLDISVTIKSRKFEAIMPSVSEYNTYAKTLTVSYPKIFKYNMAPGNGFEITSISTVPFELLHFRRDRGRGNGHIDIIKSEADVYQLKAVNQGSTELVFELEGLYFPPDSDIGIMATDLLKEM